MTTDFLALRRALASLPADVSHDATGEHSPRVEEIFAPEQHAAALDPRVPVVVGARGTGKSFWAGVLGKIETRRAAATAYPQLGLDRVDVEFGYTGVGGEGVSSDVIEARLPGLNPARARLFWSAIILRAASRALGHRSSSLSALMNQYEDPEDREETLLGLDAQLAADGRTLLVVFDALDTVSSTWERRRLITETLFQVVWSLRICRSIRVKLFLTPRSN